MCVLAIDQRVTDHLAFVVDGIGGAERTAQRAEPALAAIPVDECDDGAIVAHMGIAGDRPRRVDVLGDAIAAAKCPDPVMPPDSNT